MANDMSDLGGLSGMGEGLGGLDAGMRERDMANMANKEDMSMGFGDEPQSLSDFDTQGMGSGLSALHDGDGGGIELSAGLADEEDEAPIHAALEDEEEEAPIQAGRSEDEPIQAGYGQSERSSFGGSSGGEERSSFSAYGLGGGGDLSSNPNQSIDDIFIGGSYGRGSSSGGTTSSGGGTMYDPKKEHADVHVSVGLPPLVKNLLIIAVILAGIYAGLKYGLHVNIDNYFHPVDVQQYLESDSATLASTFNYKFKTETEKYSSSSYEYVLDVEKAGGLKLVNYDGDRIYIEVTGARLDCSIYGVRPQLTKYTEAVTILAGSGFSEVESYEETEQLGAQGEEHCFYNERTGEGVIVGKKAQYDSVKSIKYAKNYKKYKKLRTSLRG